MRAAWLLCFSIGLFGIGHTADVISTASDSCSVPVTLKTQIAKEFPKYHLPKESDNLPDDISYYRKQGGNGCLTVAQGDFDGNGKTDYALLVTNVEQNNTLLIAALQNKQNWLLEKLYDLGNDRSRLYVNYLGPGKYDRVDFEDSELEAGEVISHNSKLPGVVVGTTESSGVAFFRIPKGWVHVWISD